MIHSKVGAARKVPRSRIWIEGARLTLAGFTHAARYDVIWTGAGATLALSPTGSRRVAGTPERPIIDITGDKVRALACDRVAVEFSIASITIEKA
jgi:hypothetical protein